LTFREPQDGVLILGLADYNVVKRERRGSELNKEFSPEEYRMAEKHLKKCSTSLIIREMQIKTTLRFHFTPVRIAKIKNTLTSETQSPLSSQKQKHCFCVCSLFFSSLHKSLLIKRRARGGA
jgi:hypothetical protein